MSALFAPSRNSFQLCSLARRIVRKYSFLAALNSANERSLRCCFQRLSFLAIVVLISFTSSVHHVFDLGDTFMRGTDLETASRIESRSSVAMASSLWGEESSGDSSKLSSSFAQSTSRLYCTFLSSLVN